MTSVSAEALRGLLSELVGRECRSAVSGSGGVLSLEFDGELAILIRCRGASTRPTACSRSGPTRRATNAASAPALAASSSPRPRTI